MRAAGADAPLATALALTGLGVGNGAVQRALAHDDPGPTPAAPTSVRPLSPSERAWFEPRLGADLSAVRVHTGDAARASAAALDAAAWTRGTDVVLGAGHEDTEGPARATLAHELVHVVQQQRATTTAPGVSSTHDAPELEAAQLASALARPDLPARPLPVRGTPSADVHRQHRGDGGGTAAPTSDAPDIEIVPPGWTRRPAADDLLVAVAGSRMVALPARDVFVLLQPPAGTPAEPTVAHGPVLAVPTVGKESIKMVRVGTSTGFLVDAGGRTGVLFPSGMVQMTSALGVSDVRGIAVTHLHADHVRSLVELVRAHGVRPADLHFPAEFATNPAAPSSTFARLQRALAADPALRALGHGTAAYGTVSTASTGSFFRVPVQVGDVTFEYYGLTAAFRALQQRRAAGQPQTTAQVDGTSVPSLADTSSLVTRATHRPTGFGMLFVSDMRFEDLRLLRTAMGEAEHAAMMRGVRVVEGLGHHLGALESTAGRAAFADFLRDAQFGAGGRLTVLAQSRDGFLNRSLVEALRQAGVDVHAAMEPTGQQAGAFAVGSDGTVTFRGPGQAESHRGDPAVRAAFDRLDRLRTAERIVTQYERHLEPEYRRSADLRQAREALEQALDAHLRGTAGNVRTTAAGRAQPTLADPAAQATRLAAVTRTAPVEAMLTEPVMADLRELARLGRYYDVWREEEARARTTGRISDRGIEALWELNPDVARRLVGGSDLPRRARREALQQLPGAPPRAGTRAGAGVLLAIEVVHLVAPLVQQARASAFDADVRPALEDILWWQDKGVAPRMHAVDDNLWPVENEHTTDPARVQELLDEREVSYLALTGIPDEHWTAFTVWATTHLLNFRDWELHLLRGHAVRGEGRAVDEKVWEYRTASIRAATIGFDVVERWVRSDRLTLILNAAARAMVDRSEQQLAERGRQPGLLAAPGSAVVSDARAYRSAELLEDKPQATGRRRFRPGLGERRLYTLGSRRARTGYAEESRFYTFPPTAVTDAVPDGYVVVGGADYNTYIRVYATPNDTRTHARISPNTVELLLARTEDLVADTEAP